MRKIDVSNLSKFSVLQICKSKHPADDSLKKNNNKQNVKFSNFSLQSQKQENYQKYGLVCLEIFPETKKLVEVPSERQDGLGAVRRVRL